VWQSPGTNAEKKKQNKDKWATGSEQVPRVNEILKKISNLAQFFSLTGK
jgi:hypothetical protein